MPSGGYSLEVVSPEDAPGCPPIPPWRSPGVAPRYWLEAMVSSEAPLGSEPRAGPLRLLAELIFLGQWDGDPCVPFTGHSQLGSLPPQGRGRVSSQPVAESGNAPHCGPDRQPRHLGEAPCKGPNPRRQK